MGKEKCFAKTRIFLTLYRGREKCRNKTGNDIDVDLIFQLTLNILSCKGCSYLTLNNSFTQRRKGREDFYH